MNEIQLIIENWKEYCIEDNYINEGLTRKTYRVGDYVIKRPINELGYKCSLSEVQIYNKALELDNLSEFLLPIYYNDKNIQISQYVEPLTISGDGYDISDIEDTRKLNFRIPDDYDYWIEDLDTLGVQVGDIWHSKNLGLTKEKKLVCFDYGLTYELAKELYSEIELGNITLKIK